METTDVPEGDDPSSRRDSRPERCPVTVDDGVWTVSGHAEVLAAALDPETFSSRVTERRAIPNSLDGDEHAAYRALVDAYFTAERVEREEAQCRAHAARILTELPSDRVVDAVADIGIPFAVRVQRTWLGWPAEAEERLVTWVRDNIAATRSGDRSRTAKVAEEFDAIIGALLDARRGAPVEDVTGELLRDRVDGRPLTDAEVVSVLRNWTAGDLSSLAACVGVIVHCLATRPDVRTRVHELVHADATEELEAALEEILRMDDPFVSNRRITTRPVTIGTSELPQGARVVLHWTRANRDPQAFDDPDAFAPAHHAPRNLVFGAGPHVCPGRGLTLMELRVLVEELLGRHSRVAIAPGTPPRREQPPAGGWATVPIHLG